MYADLCVRTADSEQAIGIGERLGLDMIGLVVSAKDIPGLKKLQEKRDWRRKPRLALGVDASSPRPEDMRKRSMQRPA